MEALLVIMTIVGVLGGMGALAGGVFGLIRAVEDNSIGKALLALLSLVLAAGFAFLVYFGTTVYDQREQDACNKAAHGHGRIVGFTHGKYTEDHCFVQAPDGGWELLY